MSAYHSHRGLIVCCVILAAIATLGCAHDPRARDKVFSDDWAYQRYRDQERRPRVDQLVLFGDEDGAHASVKVDERGRPYLNFFEKRGISADLDVDHDEVEVGLKYKRAWGGAKKDAPRTIPEGHRILP